MLFRSFLTKEQLSDEEYKKKIGDDIITSYVKYRTRPRDYFYFGYPDLDDTQRDTFLTETLEDRTLMEITGYDKYLTDLTDKYHFYELAKPFFKRAIMLFDKQTDKADFISYCLKVKDLFIKPLAGSEGDGAFTAQVNDETEAESLYVKLAESNAKWMVEERIRQAEEMNAWNKSSINTVRVPAFLNKSGFYVLGTVFRTGRNNTCVDNIAAGGLFALVDEKTGIITTNGLDVKGGEFEAHPESGLVYKGWKIPKWDELIRTAEAVHRTFPSHIYIAWDFALTDNGWDLIEGNWGRLRSVQIAAKKGIKKEFLEYMHGGSIS